MSLLNSSFATWELPWTLHNAPHAVLDILRGCNVRCKDCYNSTHKICCKSMDDIMKDYHQLMAFRRVSSFGLIGGEPLLHSQLTDIISFLKSQHHTVEIYTNGLLLTEARCEQLAKAGTDLIFLHIGLGQERQDLDDNQSLEEVYKLREEKAKMVHDAGMAAAVSVTLQTSTMIYLPDVIQHFLDSKYVSYCLMTLKRETEKIGLLDGSLEDSITGTYVPYVSQEEPQMQDLIELLSQRSMTPFSSLKTTETPDVPGWLNYMFAVAFSNKGNQVLNFHPSTFEPKYCKSYFKRHNRYPFYTPGKPLLTRGQILMNGLHGNSGNLKFLVRNFTKKIMIKRLIVQSFACLAPNGKLNYCRSCPDITVKNGKIVPICMCDNMRHSDKYSETRQYVPL